ncbi:reverse transcriptase [Lithospermum erythrorhizon]|uniref:Reverse transcriptase n=1 Tax=Lithospermum erythrorhizon TaxID=34254 RepID=A0AAV3PQM5_LITER
MRECIVYIPPTVESDHCALEVKVNNDFSSSPKPFKYQHFWKKYESFHNMVKEVWDEEVVGHGLDILHIKMKKLKYEVFNGNLEVDILKKAKIIEKDYAVLVIAERKLFKSKARVTWAKNGDSSTKYFHSYMRMHHVRSRINNSEVVKMRGCQMMLVFREVDKNMLTASITDSEIDKVIVEMMKGKAPGPDDYSAEFYKDNWSIIKSSVYEAVKTCFCTGIMPKYVNSRLKKVLEQVIGVHQTTYVNGRRITDGILVEVYVESAGQNEFPAVFVKWIQICVTNAWFSVTLNGSLNGLFSSSRGLRQGDLCSPYLFIIVMETFNSLLLRNVEKNKFDYHPDCDRLRLTHVYFVDDLFLVSEATENSFRTIKKILNEFGSMTGLFPNLDKSLCFFVGVPDSVKMKLGNILSIPVGTLPIKYLGVPLTTCTIIASDCMVLVDKIERKIDGWKHKSISYAGRVVLINSVLFGTSNYWAQCVFSPQEVCKSIEKIVRTFLWSGAKDGSYKAKVAWNDVCRKKDKGGLGIKRLRDWNSACMGYHIWNICSKTETLWVQWINAYRLKGKSIWSIKGKNTDFWMWRIFLGFKAYVKKTHINVRIGYGSKCNYRMGPLNVVLSCQEISCLQVKDIDSAANGPGNPWKSSSLLRCKDVRQEIKGNVEKVKWHKIEWSCSNTQAHSFIMWMVYMQKLATKDRLMRMGILQSDSCEFYGQSESIEHFFFACEYTRVVWRKLLMYLHFYHMPTRWHSELDLMISKCKGKSLKARLCRASFCCVVYCIWLERNRTIFKNEKRGIEELLFLCVSKVRYNVYSWKNLACTRENWNTCIEWGFPLSILKHG